jgi:hypothetical protein
MQQGGTERTRRVTPGVLASSGNFADEVVRWSGTGTHPRPRAKNACRRCRIPVERGKVMLSAHQSGGSNKHVRDRERHTHVTAGRVSAEISSAWTGGMGKRWATAEDEVGACWSAGSAVSPFPDPRLPVWSVFTHALGTDCLSFSETNRS